MDTKVFNIYSGCYADLILGTAVAVTYGQVGDAIGIAAKYLESATINYADLVALNMGLNGIPDGMDFRLYINSRYVSQVVQNCQIWRDEGILEEKAHPEQVKILLEHISRLGTGQLSVSAHSWQRDEIMIRLMKHTKHFYHQAQMQMIAKQTTALDPDMFGPREFIRIKDLPGSVLWKKPFSLSEFQKRMQKARMANPAKILRLIQNND